MRIKNLLLLWHALILCALPLSAQDFSEIDTRARETPFPKNQHIEKLATALTSGLQTEKEKVRAIYVWISANIRYDVKTFEDKRDLDPTKKDALQAPNQVLRRKMGVCAGYTNLFGALCAATGIEAIQVIGITKNERGRIPRTEHVWNLVRADGQWALLDVTWGSGYLDTDTGKYVPEFDEAYFFTAPEIMILNHFPQDPLFQLLPVPITLETFKQDQATVQKWLAESSNDQTRTHDAVQDSLDAFVQLDSAARYLNSCLRTLRFDPANNPALWGLALHEHNTAIAILEKIQGDLNGRRLDLQDPESYAILDRNIQRFTEAEIHLKACVATAEKITTAGRYSKAGRQLAATARKNLFESRSTRENLEQTRRQLKQ